MSEAQKRSLHPLLLERSYWDVRLRELSSARVALFLTPRPELSSSAVEVDEFRLRAHDGTQIFGLRGRRRIGGACEHARLRVVGPSELPHVDREAVERGEAEFVFQEPAGRKLEDRVLDVLRVYRVAADTRGESDEPRDVRLVTTPGEPEPDEFLIASHLLAEELSTAAAPLDDGSGFPAA